LTSLRSLRARRALRTLDAHRGRRVETGTNPQVGQILETIRRRKIGAAIIDNQRAGCHRITSHERRRKIADQNVVGERVLAESGNHDTDIGDEEVHRPRILDDQ
jgi:hypothetical protein